MARKKKILYPVLFMILLTAVFTFVLAFINASSIDLIREQEELRIQRSILYVFDVAHEDSDESVSSTFNQFITTETEDSKTYYVYKTDGEIKGYAFEFSGKGLWGTITGNIALAPKFDKILGVDFISHSETPGLGGRIDEDWFKEQFRDMDVNTPSPVIFKPAEGGNVDAVTGATLTSNSVRDMINSFIEKIDQEVMVNE